MRPPAWWVAAPVAVLLLLFGCSDSGTVEHEEDTVAETVEDFCPWDGSTHWSSAESLPLPHAPIDGWLCPVGDVDWFLLTLAEDDEILTVRLAMDGDLSPVQPSYAVQLREGSGLPGSVAASPPAAALGLPLDEAHCVSPGTYYLAVRDHNEDAQDIRRAYRLSVTTALDPDSLEPNDDVATATELVPNEPTAGLVACLGDKDWYRLAVTEPNVLRVRLKAPRGDLDPWLEVRDAGGKVLMTDPRSGDEPQGVSIDRYLTVAAGEYFFSVADDDGFDAGPDATYTLTVEAYPELDLHEPNQHPDEATALRVSPLRCTREWSEVVSTGGTIGSPGDEDWVRLDLAGCENGLIEAELILGRPGATPAEQRALLDLVQAALALVRPDPASPCEQDTDCQSLARGCGSIWDCSGWGLSCLPTGACLGASVCLSDGVCGANQVERHAVETVATGPDAPVPENRALVSAPLLADGVTYLKVSDFRSDGAAPGAPYTLNVRVRMDPDLSEPSNVYMPNLDKGFPPQVHLAEARPIPVHECVPPGGPGDPPPSCCGPHTWIEGRIGYENDLDWFRYTHPCPEKDCLLRVVYEVDPGPVDLLFSIHVGAALWYDTVNNTSEKAQHAFIAGHMGGVDPSDRCFYAFRGHKATQQYYMMARDLAHTRDWDPDQRYRFCIEKVAARCEKPCKQYTDGCGQ